MTNQPWHEIFTIAAQLTTNRRNAARLTNLAIAAVVANRRGLCRHRVRHVLGSADLQALITDIALFSLPSLSTKKRLWAELATRVSSAAEGLDKPTALDTWVESWHNLDPGRKTRGAYATPSAFAAALAEATLQPLLHKSEVLAIVDPSVGAGALLLAAFRFLSQFWPRDGRRRILKGLHGVELDPATRELCCFLLWIEGGVSRSDLDLLAGNIIVGDALLREWWKGKRTNAYDALLMNPPWESLRHSLSAKDPFSPHRRAVIERLSQQKTGAQGLPPLFTAQGRGDRNLFKAFMELAPHLLRDGGRFGALVPGAFASDFGMGPLRERYFKQLDLETWTGFENLRRHFLIDSRYKFGLLIGSRSALGTELLRVRSFATGPDETRAEHAHIAISELSCVGGPSRMIPELMDQEEKDILVRALSRGTQFFAPGCLGRVVYKRELDLTIHLSKGSFCRFEKHPALTPTEHGSYCSKDGTIYVPVVEGRMVGQYDIFQKSWVAGRGRTAHWELNDQRSLGCCRPQFITAAPDYEDQCRVAICDVTSATNTRTVHATWVPSLWRCGNTAPVLKFSDPFHTLVGLGILNSMVFDWITRRILGGLHLNKFYLAALAWPQICQRDLHRLASAAASLCRCNPRFAEAGGELFLGMAGASNGDVSDPVKARATIETLVARGFGIEVPMLARIFSSSKTDRRGFWRVFDSDPLASAVVERLLISPNYGFCEVPILPTPPKSSALPQGK